MPDMKRVHREVAALLKNMNSQFDGQVIIDVTNLEEGLIIKLFICPNAGKHFYNLATILKVKNLLALIGDC